MENENRFLLRHRPPGTDNESEFHAMRIFDTTHIINQETGEIEQVPSTPVPVEKLQQDLEQIKQVKGKRYFAFVLGAEYFQDRFFMAKDEQDGRKPGYFTSNFEAVKLFLPEIYTDPELGEIFRTAFLLRAEEQKLYDELFDPQSLLSKEEIEEKIRQLNLLGKKIWDYETTLQNTPKPEQDKQALPISKLCIVALRHEIRSEAVPEEHIHECPICSTNCAQ